MTSRENGDLIMMGIGGFTPLDGFMTRADWEGVCDGMMMANGLFWPIPITLSTDKASADTFKEGDDIALFDPERNEILATMTVTEKYTIDKAHECMQVYKTTDMEHPGVQNFLSVGKVFVAGPIQVLNYSYFAADFPETFRTAVEIREFDVLVRERHPFPRVSEVRAATRAYFGWGALVGALLTYGLVTLASEE